jgi:hypothetical protein
VEEGEVMQEQAKGKESRAASNWERAAEDKMKSVNKGIQAKISGSMLSIKGSSNNNLHTGR